MSAKEEQRVAEIQNQQAHPDGTVETEEQFYSKVINSYFNYFIIYF